MFERIRAFFRDNPRMWAVVSVAVLIAIIVVWGVYGGFSFQISRFFAGQEPLPTAIPGNCGPSVPAGGDFNWSFGSSPGWGGCGDGTAATYWTKVSVGTCHPDGLHLVWRAEHRDAASCDIALAGSSIAEGSGITTSVTNFSNMDLPDGQGGTAQMTYDPKTFDCGSVRLWGAFWASGTESKAKNAGYTGYYKVINYGHDCSATPTASATPVPTAPVTCAPAAQSILVGQIATLTASGGNGVFHWDSSGGGVVQSGGNETVGFSYTTAGTKTINLTSGTSAARCTVTVTGVTATPASTVTGLTLTKTGQNLTTGGTPGMTVTANANDSVQFTLVITNNTGTAVTDLTLTDQVPGGMTYYPGSLNVQNQVINNDTITTTGLQLGQLNAGDSVTLQWSAIADRTGLLPPGPQTSLPNASATTAEGATANATMNVVVIGTGTTAAATPVPTVSGVGGVSTGPGDAMLIALIVSALVAFLYAGYTRSNGFRRRELEQLGHSHDPLDFRS